MANRGIGRGLEALLSGAGQSKDGEEFQYLSVESIKPNPRQPRSGMDEPGIGELARSVEAKGVLQPVIVKPSSGGVYELIAGERRWRAAKRAGLERVPAVVRDGQDSESLELALVENMAREDLNAVDEARACSALIEELGLTHEEVGRRVGRSRATVSNLVRLLELPDEVLRSIERDELSEGHGRAILQCGNHEDRRRLGRRVVKDGLSVRETEALARATNQRRGPRILPEPHPDQEEARLKVEERLSEAFGVDVRVRLRRRHVAVEFPMTELDDLMSLADLLDKRFAA